jgi:hypothetical protein
MLWKEVVVMYFKVLAQNLLGKVEDNGKFYDVFFLDHNTNVEPI